ncbi:MAG TPA: hypothetical protein VML35_10530 [Gaiellaceae bacterium]|nr:hypothetical protein [Gaiellaceae bacterium]
METMVADDVTRQILARYEAADLIISCAWCRRVVFDDAWQRAPRAALAAIDEQLTLSHSICPSCSAAPPPSAA